mgnify:CR=1 FL=1
MEDKKEDLKNEIIKTEKDWFLQDLVGMVNNSNLTIGLTIVTHGFLVSGTLIGGKQYFIGFGEEMDTGIGETDNGKTIRENFEKIGTEIYSEEKQKKDGNPTFIHFKEAKFFHPNGNPIPGNRGVWWRGRISEVSGFSLGTLNAEQN